MKFTLAYGSAKTKSNETRGPRTLTLQLTRTVTIHLNIVNFAQIFFLHANQVHWLTKNDLIITWSTLLYICIKLCPSLKLEPAPSTPSHFRVTLHFIDKCTDRPQKNIEHFEVSYTFYQSP